MPRLLTHEQKRAVKIRGKGGQWEEEKSGIECSHGNKRLGSAVHR